MKALATIFSLKEWLVAKAVVIKIERVSLVLTRIDNSVTRSEASLSAIHLKVKRSNNPITKEFEKNTTLKMFSNS
jgi:hypothetical protein